MSCAKFGQLSETLAREMHVSRGWTVRDPQSCTNINGSTLPKQSAPYDYLMSLEPNGDSGVIDTRVEVKSARMTWVKYQQRYVVRFRG
eukprot:5023520-Amphidinium_carterae.1